MIILARKGSICLTVDNGGLYGVEKEKISKKYGKIYLAKFFSEDKQSAINYFNKKNKRVQSTCNDFNLNIYAHT